jgi:hypothetical protein
MSGHDRAVDSRVICQLDVWLRGIGLVTVRHVEDNAYLAIDCAAVRIEQAIVRKLREAGRYVAVGNDLAVATPSGRATPRRYAVLIVPFDAWPRLSLIPWLRSRHGIGQVQTISLSRLEWDALGSGELDSPHLKRLRERLALAQLSLPDAIVVAGGAAPQSSWEKRPQARVELERALNTVRLLGLPVEVIGLWVNEQWRPDDCLIESEELPPPAGHGDDSEEELYAALTSD